MKISLQRPFIATAITLIVCLAVMLISLYNPLEGHFNHFFLPAEKFGVPAELHAHGITALYKGNIETGWDGQFYYYIANDLFANKDTLQHIDASAYRYQRIGLPLLANIAAKITGQSWVNPLTYYLTSLLIILIAVSIASVFFQRKNLSPFLILPWALACGTQVTLLHGLPDAAADGLLIIALISLTEKRFICYALSMTLAALSREAYILFPLITTLILFLLYLRENNLRAYLNISAISGLLKTSWFHLFPLIIFASWQIFLRIKFHIAPSAQAEGILNWPLVSAIHYMAAGFNGNHPIVGTNYMAYLESGGIVLFLLLLIINAVMLSNFLSKVSTAALSFTTVNADVLGITLTFIALIIMYLCFGPTVMMYHTGYFKAANIFLFALPFFAALRQCKLNQLTLLFLIFITAYFDFFLWHRITANPYRPAPTIHYVKTMPACLSDYRASIVPVSLETFASNGLIRKLLSPHRFTLNVKITNLSQQVFSPYLGKGSTNLSYQWLNAGNPDIIVLNGPHVPLTKALAPHQSTVLPIYLDFPRMPGHYLLKISLVQEGCSWFYLANPSSAFTVPYTVNW